MPHLRSQAGDYFLFFENRKVCKRRGAGKRVCGVRMAVEEGFKLLVFTQECAVYFLARKRGGKRQVTSGYTLGKAHKIRAHVLVFYGKHFPGPSENGGNLVAN